MTLKYFRVVDILTNVPIGSLFLTLIPVRKKNHLLKCVLWASEISEICGHTHLDACFQMDFHIFFVILRLPCNELYFVFVVAVGFLFCLLLIIFFFIL